MKKLTYLLLLPIIALCIYGFTFKKETKTLTLSSKIQADLAQLKADLATNSDCPASSSQIGYSDLASGRAAFVSMLKYPTTDTTHYGIIGINDLISMLMENDGRTVNNCLVYYPIIARSGEPAVAFNGAQLVSTSSIMFSSTCKHYISSWCPSICPK